MTLGFLIKKIYKLSKFYITINGISQLTIIKTLLKEQKMMSPIVVLIIEKPNYLDKAGLHILISFVFLMILVATADYVTNFKASVNLSVV